ncbi:RBM15B [Cordylochernes scorpioides]|uniref:RNA-directed DNA polymerase n=1 Tax=Cordylochernes scorpioides TaxID=51811 RepID=A0ABY6L228_9ARAC|nr:RBM15B [Cordylochernes scorpioides]
MHPGDDPSPSQTPLPSALYHLEKFEGNGLIPFDKFIRDFELVYDVKALDDSRRRILLDNHLRGAAREFALQASQIKLGYNELKENLEQRFSRRAPKREARKKFFSCRQRPGEKVKEYANRVRSLASEAESDGQRIDITEVADIFLTGLCPNLWQRAHQLQNESWEVIVSSLHQIEERDDEYSRCQMEDEEGSARKLRELTSQMARLESKLKNLETENQDLRRTHREQPRMNMGNRWNTNQARGFQRRGGSAQNNQPTIQGTRQERPQQNPNGRAPQEQRKEGPPATTKGGAPRGYEGPEATRTPIRCFRCGETGHMARICTAMTKKIGPACLKAGNGGTLAGLPVITCTFVDKGWSLSNRTIRLIIDTGSEANIVNIDSLDISAEGLGKPTFLKGISGSELRSLGSELIEVRAYIRGKPIREVKTTFEYCHLGGLGFDGILGMPGFKALRLTLNHDGSVRSDFEQDEEPTKSAFLSSLQASEVPVRPPSIPLHKIRTGEDVLRAYSHCFCDDISDMGDGSTIIAPKLKILTGKPVYRRQYPIPNKLVSKVKALVDELEEAGIIEGSTSLWNSPLFPVAKTDGSVRITMDLRLINEVTEFFPFPIPRVEDNLRAFAGAKVFSTLDLTSGFFQIRIPEGDRDYFTFSLPWGRYRFTRLPQGAKNSAQIFQWAMNLVLGDLLYKCVRLYIDDVIVYSDSHEQHVADLAAVLERLSRFNLKARRGKSYFFKGSVDYLGHVIDQDGIKPMWDNVAALRDLKRPHNIRGVRSLLGTVNYYRRFIPNAGELLAPLSNLLRKGRRFTWGTIGQTAFETIKQVLTSEPLLAHPMIGRPFILNTDASGIAVGACLQQEIDGVVKPIAHYSKRLIGPETRYSTIEKEAYAVVLSLQHFKHLLAGSKVEVHTDHKPITYNKGSDYKNARLSRWAEIIQDFNVTFVYVPGKENTVADFLSRFPCEDDPEPSRDKRVVAAVIKNRGPPLIDSDRTWEGLLKDKKWAPLLKLIGDRRSTETVTYKNKDYKMHEGYLVSKNSGGIWVKVVPPDIREMVIKYHHDVPTGGHFGVKKVMRRLKDDYYWPGMRTQVRNYIYRCEGCQLSNQGVTKAGNAPHFRPGKPFEHLALDFIGPLEKTSKGHSSILTIVDLFTKFPILIPTRDQCANTVVKALLESVITIFGVPKTILSDRGSAFISCIFKGICKAMGVSAVNTTAWRPQSNGAVERLNRTVIESLRRCEAGSNWDDILPMVALAIRTTEHSSTGFTPAKLVFGHELRLPQPFQEAGQSPVSEDLIAQTAAFYERELTEEVEKMREVVRQTYLNEQEEARIKFENKRLRTFNNGDLVLVERMHETKGRHKFEPSYQPYLITSKKKVSMKSFIELEDRSSSLMAQPSQTGGYVPAARALSRRERNERDSPLKIKRTHSRYDDSPRERSSPERRDRRGLNKSPNDRSRVRSREPSSERLLNRNPYDEYPRKSRSPYYKILCATNISSKISDNTIKDSLQREYERYGDLTVKVDNKGYESGGRLAYIYFRNAEDAREAYRAKNRIMIGEKAAHVEPLIERSSRRNRSFSPEYGSHLRTLSPTHSSSSTNSFGRRRYNSIDRNVPYRDAYRKDIKDYPPPRREESKKEKFPNYLHHVPPEQDDKATRTLFVGNLEITISEAELREIFERYGIVEDVDVKRPMPGQGNAYAFIKFLNLDMAHDAKVAMSGHYIGKFQCKIGYGKATPTTRIWVGGLGPWTSLTQLEREFDRFGAIRKIDFIKGKNHAYIQYDSIDAAQAACQEMRGYPLGGPDKRLRVDFADPGPFSAFYYSPPRPYRDDTDPYLSPPFPLAEEYYWPRSSSRLDPLYEKLAFIPDDWPDRGYPDSRAYDRMYKSWFDTYDGSSRSDTERRKRPRSPECDINREDGFKRIRHSTTPEPGESRKSPPHIRENNSKKPKENSKMKSRNQETKSKPRNNSETLAKSTNDVVNNATNIQDLSKCYPIAWQGCIILKNSAFPCKMHQCLGDATLVDCLMKTPDVSTPTLRITQRLKLDKPKLDDVAHRIEKAGIQNHCILLTLSGVQQASEDMVQQRPLRNLVSYLKQKEAAGVISLPSSKDETAKKETSSKELSGVLYAFPPCPFSFELLKKVAPNLSNANIKDDHLIIVVVRGST